MKITNSALLFAAAIGAVSAKDTPLRRARNLQDTTINPVDAIEADGRGSKSGEPFDGDLGSITHLKGDCFYDFPDEDNFEVLSGSPDAMTCIGERCNLSLEHNRVVGLNLEEIKEDEKLVGFFNLNCPDTFKASFGLSCPIGYNVEKIFALTTAEKLVVDCELGGNGRYCIVKEFDYKFGFLNGEKMPDKEFGSLYKYFCKKIY